jgi:hypothetical protein
LRANGAENVGRGGALILRRGGPAASFCPAAGDLVLLADPGLIGEPQLYVGRIDALIARDLIQKGGEAYGMARPSFPGSLC